MRAWFGAAAGIFDTHMVFKMFPGFVDSSLEFLRMQLCVVSNLLSQNRIFSSLDSLACKHTHNVTSFLNLEVVHRVSECNKDCLVKANLLVSSKSHDSHGVKIVLEAWHISCWLYVNSLNMTYLHSLFSLFQTACVLKKYHTPLRTMTHIGYSPVHFFPSLVWTPTYPN